MNKNDCPACESSREGTVVGGAWMECTDCSAATARAKAVLKREADASVAPAKKHD
jgi:hypothetical protein